MNAPYFGRSISQDTMFSVFGFTPNEVDLKQNYSAKICFHHSKVVLALTVDIFQIFRRSSKPKRGEFETITPYLIRLTVLPSVKVLICRIRPL